MGTTDLTTPVSLAMAIKNRVVGRSAPRVDWENLKARAGKLGVDTSKFNKHLGPELDKLVVLLTAAKAVKARPGGPLSAADKLILAQQGDKVEEIVDGYVEMLKTEMVRPGITSAQREALDTLKRNVKQIAIRYKRLATERSA